MPVLNMYKNRLFGCIEKANIDPTFFETSDEEKERDKTFRIQLVDSPIRFLLHSRKPGIHEIWCQYNSFTEPFNYVNTLDDFNILRHPDPKESIEIKLNHLIMHFKIWLSNSAIPYIKDLEAPNLWSRLKDYEPFITNSLTQKETTNFTPEERAQLRIATQEFRLLTLQTFSPSIDQIQVISDRLEYLADATERLNRFDWKGIALSTIISISITLSLDTQKGKLLYQLFLQAFRSALRLLSD